MIKNEYLRFTNPAGEMVWAVGQDGHVEFGSGYTADEASKLAAKMFADYLVGFMAGGGSCPVEPSKPN